jgi:hypothetical protein
MEPTAGMGFKKTGQYGTQKMRFDTEGKEAGRRARRL